MLYKDQSVLTPRLAPKLGCNCDRCQEERAMTAIESINEQSSMSIRVSKSKCPICGRSHCPKANDHCNECRNYISYAA